MKYAIQQFVFSADDCVRISPFAQITITVAGTTDPADLWDDSEGLTPIDGNTVLADETGYFRVYADAGFYDIEILAGSITRTLQDVAVGAGSGGSNFAGDWDMSIGAGGGAAVMANDYNATHTATTIMASSTIVGAGTYRFAGSSSGVVVIDNPDAADNPCTVVLTDLAHKSAAGDGICVVAICNSSATSDDLLALFNGDAPANPVYGAAMQVDTYADQVRIVGFAGTALDTSNAWQAADYSGTDGVHGIRYYYDTGTAESFWHPADDYVVDVAAITAAGQQLRVWFFCLPQTDMVNPTGFGYFLYGDNQLPNPAFPLVSDAVLPDGAVDGDWYRVTGAGTFAGVDTVIGDYVKLIDGMTDIIAVHYGSDGDQGPQGDPGPAGADGAPGADGAQGDPGPAGADGASAYDVAVANGFVGDEIAWLASLVGADGAVGVAGAKGDKGDDGDSAYQVAVTNGFVGTESQWLASLVGAKGDKGDKGDTGNTGPAGATGADGDAGWSPVFSVVTDGARRVLQVSDWTGGEGTKPATGDYVGASGLTSSIASAVDIRGDTGPTGPATISVGTVTTGAAGSSAAVTNVGSSSVAVFDFTIPKGDKGDTGASGGNAITILQKTAAYTVVAGDLGAVIQCTANTFTVSLTSAATLGDGFTCWVWNTSNTATHVITIDPNSTETIDGATTLILRRGEGVQIVCDGTNWQTAGTKKQRLYSENAANNATRPVVSGSNACAFGNAAQATGTSSVANGDGAIATGTSAIAIGTGRATTTDSVAIAITNNTTTYGANTNIGAVAIGTLNLASGEDSAVVGGASCVASGIYSAVVGGGACTAVNAGCATIGGQFCTASMGYSAAIAGYQCTASGAYSAVIGGNLCTASGSYSAVIAGYGGLANVSGKIAHASGYYRSSGATQYGLVVLTNDTTGNTPTVLKSDSNAVGATNQIVISNNQSMSFRGQCVAQRKGSESTTSTAAWEFSGVIRRGVNAASTALVSSVTPTLIAADSDASTWSIAVTANTTLGCLTVTVTGENSKSIRWVCTLQSTEVVYA